MITRIGQYAIAIFGCGLLGSISGAIVGGLVALLVLSPATGCIIGAIAGFVAGLIGASFGGPPGFMIGGLIGGTVAIACFPGMFLLLFIPPFLVLVIGYSFGDYLDNQLRQEKPSFFLALLVKRLIGQMAQLPHRNRITTGVIFSSTVAVLCFFAAWKLYYLLGY